MTQLPVLFHSCTGVHGHPDACGRVRGVPRHCRHGELCHTGVVGNVHHNMFACLAFDTVRQSLRHLFATGTLSLCAVCLTAGRVCAVSRCVPRCFGLHDTVLG